MCAVHIFYCVSADCVVVYHPSPTKRAAKVISDKAFNRRINRTKYKSPIKPPKQTDAGNTSEAADQAEPNSRDISKDGFELVLLCSEMLWLIGIVLLTI